jgi:hypothetical protein
MISIKRLAELREELGVTHLILFSIDENGCQNIATHGKSEHQAVEAAEMGNDLKKMLGWDKHIDTKPYPRECYYCDYYETVAGFGNNPGKCCFSIPQKDVYSERKACGNFVSRF